MFEIGWSELLVIAMVAIVVIGPKDLPRVMRTVGQWAGKMKRMSREFQNQFSEALREAELEDVRKDVEEIGKGLREEVSKAGEDIHKGLNVEPPAAGLPPPDGNEAAHPVDSASIETPDSAGAAPALVEPSAGTAAEVKS